jgi:hypothetical protein
MPATLASPEFARTALAFCAAIAAARRLVMQEEMGARLSAQLDYAASSLDAIDVQLVEAGLAADAPQRAIAARLRERFERLLLRLATSSLRTRAMRASRRAPQARPRSRRVSGAAT